MDGVERVKARERERERAFILSENILPEMHFALFGQFIGVVVVSDRGGGGGDGNGAASLYISIVTHCVCVRLCAHVSLQS